MRRGKLGRAGAVTAVAGLVSAVAACGDPITAQRTWVGLGLSTSFTSSATAPDGTTVVSAHRVLSGWLTDSAGRVIDGTEFRQDCVDPVSSGGRLLHPRDATGAPPPTTCTIVLNSGAKVYIANGTASARYATFGALGQGGGSLQFSLVKTVRVAALLPDVPGAAPVAVPRGDKGLGTTGYVVRITARP